MPVNAATITGRRPCTCILICFFDRRSIGVVTVGAIAPTLFGRPKNINSVSMTNRSGGVKTANLAYSENRNKKFLAIVFCEIFCPPPHFLGRSCAYVGKCKANGFPSYVQQATTSVSPYWRYLSLRDGRISLKCPHATVIFVSLTVTRSPREQLAKHYTDMSALCKSWINHSILG